jgi:hypothetical protein
MRFLMVIGCLMCCGIATGQQEFNQEVVKKMEVLGVYFMEPLDTDYKISYPSKKRRDQIFDYDFKIQLDDREVLVRMIEETSTSIISYPHLEFQRLMMHLASNEEGSNIYYYDIPKEEGVDWMSEARFTPKEKLSNRKYGTAKLYYKEGRGMIQVIYLDKKLQTLFQPLAVFKTDQGEN